MEHTVHRGMVGTTVGNKWESFTDLDFADDVAIFAKMISVLLQALEVMEMEARPLGLTINWAKTKIQYLGDLDEDRQHATVQGNQVVIVESFTYLGSLVHCSGSSELEIKWRANFVREVMFMTCWIRIYGDPTLR